MLQAGQCIVSKNYANYLKLKVGDNASLALENSCDYTIDAVTE